MNSITLKAQLLRMPELKAGRGALATLVDTLTAWRVERLLVVTSPELVSCGVLHQLLTALEASPLLKAFYFDQVTPDPSFELVEKLVAFGRANEVDCVLALGGGSPIDAAKVAAALINSEQNLKSIVGTNLVTSVLPLIAIPTTAGTGSEVTPVAILTDTEDQIKKGVVSEKLIPRLAILDPDLTLKLPKSQTAFTGLDALSHAVEAFNSKKATALSDFYAQTAMELIMTHLRRAYEDGHDVEARAAMQLAAYYAGIAFANAGVTAAHAFAYPLGARYHLPHGLAVILMLPAVLEYNQVGQEPRFHELAKILTGNPQATAADVVPCLVKLCRDLGIQLGLSHSGIEEAALNEMAASVLTITRILDNNPRPIERLDQSSAIFQRAYLYA